MKTLLVLRHGKSSWSDPALADHDRPLKKRGRRAAKRIGELLAELDLLPDLVTTSSARRAHDTARRVVAAAGCEPRFVVTRELYGSGVSGHLRVVASHARESDRVVMIVGHNPDLEALVGRLTGATVRLKTAFLAVVELPLEEWPRLAGARGRLQRLLEPERG